MKKPTLLLVSSYDGYRTMIAGVLGASFHVISRNALPDADEFAVKRADIILVVNLWKRVSAYAVYEFAEAARIPVVVLVDGEYASINQLVKRSIYLTVLVNPVTNDQLIASLLNALEKTPSPVNKMRNEREEYAEKTVKSAFRSPTFRGKIDKIIHHLQRNYADVKNFQELARKYDVNYEGMRRAVEFKTGKSPAEYLREIRLEKMLQLIQFTTLSSEEICTEVGLHDVPHARKLFKEKFGLSVRDCIDQLRCTP